MPRKRTFQTFREAQKLGAYAELPMLPDDSQIQVRLSHNRGRQPFFSLFSKDTLIFLLSGAGEIEFRDVGVRSFALVPGDCIYVPAGTAHCLQHPQASVVLRYVPHPDCAEGVAWYCPRCPRELHRKTWDLASTLPQHGYLAACAAFNEAASHRQCPDCGEQHEPIDPSAWRWEEVARQAAQP
jgi:hypothetical protein